MELAFGDVRFLEQLLSNGFDECYFIFISNIKSFWKSNRVHKIYEYFNDGIIKTLEKSDVPEFIRNSDSAFRRIKKVHSFIWSDLKVQRGKKWRYFKLDVKV
jgi:hypothetical protein